VKDQQDPKKKHYIAVHASGTFTVNILLKIVMVYCKGRHTPRRQVLATWGERVIYIYTPSIDMRPRLGDTNKARAQMKMIHKP
jgi:hypothetical protein